MNRKFLICLLVLFILSACSGKKEQDDPIQGCDIVEDCGEQSGVNENLSFKEAYETLNGVQTPEGETIRTISIPADHPYVKVQAEDIIDRIRNKETFYVYIGDELCPWCRSVIETATAVANKAGVDTIYYVKVWDSEGNELVRDRYKLEDSKPVKTVEGLQAYYELLEQAADFLDDYILEDEKGNEVAVGEKRIYIPCFFYVENGRVLRYVTGISDQQEDAYQKLDEALLSDEETIFDSFFGLPTK